MEKDKFTDVVAYFENLATTHKEIKAFFRMELDEVLGDAHDLKTPALILEGYSFNFTDKGSDNIQKNRDGSFMIVDVVSDPNDYTKQHEVWDKCEEIAGDILARIKNDKRNLNTVVKNFKIDDYIEGKLLMSEINGLFGVKVSYRISTNMNMDYDPSKWITPDPQPEPDPAPDGNG